MSLVHHFFSKIVITSGMAYNRAYFLRVHDFFPIAIKKTITVKLITQCKHQTCKKMYKLTTVLLHTERSDVQTEINVTPAGQDCGNKKN